MGVTFIIFILLGEAMAFWSQDGNQQNWKTQAKIKSNPKSIGKQKLLLLYRECWKTCGPGKECITSAVAPVVSCVCKKRCPAPRSREAQVCGIDKVTYPTMCELYRQACMSGQSTHPKHQGPCVPRVSVRNNVFYAFASNGVHVIDPKSGVVVRHIKSNEQVPGTAEILCVPNLLSGAKCDWADVVAANLNYIFALDHSRRRIIVLDTRRQIPARVLYIDSEIEKIYYMKTLDEVWVVLKDKNRILVLADDLKSLVKIRKQTITLPGGDFEAKWKIKLATENCDKPGERSGSVYYVNGINAGFYLIEGASRSITLHQNLSDHGCLRAESLVHSTTAGYLFISCRTEENRKKLFIYNSRTKTMHRLNASFTEGVGGSMSISPEGDFMVATSDYKVSVFHWNKWEKRLKRLQDLEMYGFYPSNVAFSRIFGGYVIYMTSKERPNIVKLRMTGDDIEADGFLNNVGQAAKFSGEVYERKIKQFKWELKAWFNKTGVPLRENELMERVHDMYLSNVQRPIEKGCGWNDRYMASPAASSGKVAIIDGREGKVVKVMENLPGAKLVVWVGE